MAEQTKIRVLHLVTRMNVGGVAVLIDNLLENMDRNEFECVLVTGSCEFPEGDYLENKGHSYQKIQLARFHKSISLLDDAVAIFQITKIIRDFKPDVIHTHTSKAGVFGRILAKILYPKAKVVHTFHGHLLIGYFNLVKLFIVKSVEKALGLITHSLIAMGTQVRNDLVAASIAPESKFKIFLPGLKTQQFLDKATARKNLNMADEGNIVTFIGRLTSIKRPERVLDVAKKVAVSDKTVRFLIVGEGELSEGLHKRVINENLPITFLGWRDNISEILSASDMLLLTSDNEAVALTLIEASQAGIPVVTTPAGSVRDIAIDGENGIVTTFDISDISQSVLTLIGDPSLRKTMGAAGKSRAENLFSIEHMVDSHEQLYKELLSN